MNLMDSPAVDLPVSHEASPPQPARARHVGVWLCAAVLFAAGVFVRVVPSAGFSGAGFDEVLYRNYVIQLEHVGLGGYPAMCEHYLQDQRKPETMTKLPPTRFLYVLSGYLWKRAVFGDARAWDVRSPDLAQKDPALIALRSVSCFFRFFSSASLASAGEECLAAPRLLGFWP